MLLPVLSSALMASSSLLSLFLPLTSSSVLPLLVYLIPRSHYSLYSMLLYMYMYVCKVHVYVHTHVHVCTRTCRIAGHTNFKM